MPFLSAALSRRVDDVAASLGVVRDGDGPALRAILPELRELLDSDVSGAYGLTQRDRGVRLEYFWSRGLDAAAFAPDLDRVLETTPRFGFYDPFCPEPPQRNTVCHFRETPANEATQELYRRHRLLDTPQLRILLCEGDSLLAWVGVLRRAPYGVRERAMMKRLLKPLRDRALLERHLAQAPAATQLLGAAMDAIGGAAYLLRGDAVVHANAAASVALQADRAATLDRLRAHLAGRGDGTMTLSRHAGPGSPEYVLAIARPPRRDPVARAESLGATWGLSASQRRVLAMVSTGASNKATAGTLRCSEGTVESHVTAILAKVGCENRAALVARFWTDG
jgi:DNA-binding CsgD family transcriptional regulator